MGNRAWSDEEIHALRAAWDTDLTVDEIALFLPERSAISIRVQAKRLGLRHTKEQTHRIMSKQTAGERNGMSGHPGPRRGIVLSEGQREHLSQIAKMDFVSGHRQPLTGAANPAFGKPGSMRGKRMPVEALATLSRKARLRWDEMSPVQKQAKIDQLRQGRARQQAGQPTRIEKRVRGWLSDLGFTFEVQARIDFYTVDFLVSGRVIECQGDYWHANPRKYVGASINRTQAANVRRDKAKMTFLSRRGYPVLCLWECDIWTNPDGCQKRIEEFLA